MDIDRAGCAFRIVERRGAASSTLYVPGSAANTTRSAKTESAWASPPCCVRGPIKPRRSGACAGGRCKFNWDMADTADTANNRIVASHMVSPARRVRGPFRPRMCGECAEERRKFDSIGVSVTGAPRLWPVLRHGCAGRARGSAASSTRSAWASPAHCVCGPFYATDVRGVHSALVPL
jgi:hypothetical protein